MRIKNLYLAAILALSTGQLSANDFQVLRDRPGMAQALAHKDAFAALPTEAKLVSFSGRGDTRAWRLALAPVSFQITNYAQCILKNMPGAMNDAVAEAIAQSCARDHPTLLANIEKGSGIGWFSFADPQSCVKKKAGDTPNQLAARHIAISCHCLYGTPASKGEPCWRPAG